MQGGVFKVSRGSLRILLWFFKVPQGSIENHRVPSELKGFSGFQNKPLFQLFSLLEMEMCVCVCFFGGIFILKAHPIFPPPQRPMGRIAPGYTELLFDPRRLRGSDSRFFDSNSTIYDGRVATANDLSRPLTAESLRQDREKNGEKKGRGFITNRVTSKWGPGKGKGKCRTSLQLSGAEKIGTPKTGRAVDRSSSVWFLIAWRNRSSRFFSPESRTPPPQQKGLGFACWV